MTTNDLSRNGAMNQYQRQVQAVMKEKGQHMTRQRMSIAGQLYAMRGHPTIGELYDELKKTEPGVGLATVYRTLQMLKDVGLVMELRGHKGSTRFEAVLASRHHDHFVCRKCGAVIEICSRELEQLQSELAREYNFFPEEQAHCVYGLCRACYSNWRSAPSK